MNISEEIRALLAKVHDCIAASPWKGVYIAEIEKMQYDLERSCELAVVGTVNAGKSSFINTLLEEDLAVVKATEATATINYFKYAERKEALNKVYVVYTDGHSEWKDKAFLDSLQGNTEAVLELSKNIDHLEFYVNNRTLKNITIIDTPGTGSVVGAHTNIVEKYISEEQCERNIRESYRLMRKADALILLVAHVPKVSDMTNVERFTDETVPYNSIGVMSKIDQGIDIAHKEWMDRCKAIQSKLNDRLHSILPISSILYKSIRELEHSGLLQKFHGIINGITEPSLIRTFQNGTAWKQLHGLISEQSKTTVSIDSKLTAKSFSQKEEEALTACGLDIAIRTEIVNAIPEPSVRTIILSELWGKEYSVAVADLIERSGFESLKTVLESQFFSRARIIRCHSVLRRLKELLKGMLFSDLPELKREASYKPYYITVINQFNGVLGSYSNQTDKILKSFRKLVERNTSTTEDITRLSESLDELDNQCDSLIFAIESLNDRAEGLQLLESNRSMFSSDEIEELELLFGKCPDNNGVLAKLITCSRDVFWSKRAYVSIDNVIKRISTIAYRSWSDYLTRYENEH